MLIGPDLVLTNHHVVNHIVEQKNRAITYERFAKEAQLRGWEAQRKSDCGEPF